MLRIIQNLNLNRRWLPADSVAQLLQMSTLELELEIKQQLELNPLLEETMEQREEEMKGRRSQALKKRKSYSGERRS